MSPRELEALTTPCALVELERVEGNAATMAARARRLGVRLRPHVKTHKCVEAAWLQAVDRAITVSTVAEARGFGDAGFGDSTYAVPVDPRRLPELARLASRLERLALLVDDEETIAALEACTATSGQRLTAYLKIDCGAHRAGVDPEGEEALRLARRLDDAPLVDLAGLLTHAGHAYRCRTRLEVERVAAEERDRLLACAARLRGAGVAVPELSLGSTPTAVAVDHLDGVDEMRPGNYLFFDAFQLAIGSCAEDELAFSVLASVIGRRCSRRELLVNAGALALSRDPGPVHVDPECGFGLVLSPDLEDHFAGLRVVALTQEHGLLSADRSVDLERFPPGTLVRVIPNHSCLAAAAFDRFFVLRGRLVVDEWRPLRGW